MNSATYGLPQNSVFGYSRKIGYATRISTDGIYLHQLDETVWAQGNTNLARVPEPERRERQWYFRVRPAG